MRNHKWSEVTTLVTIFFLCLLAVIMGTCSGCRASNRDHQTTPHVQRPDCPPCPPCLVDEPITDPLAGSKLNDGFTDEQRVQFIRDATASSVQIMIYVHTKELGEVNGGGTGVAIRPHLILTAAHVVEDYRFSIAIQRILGRDDLTIVHPRAFEYHIIALSKARDVALLSLDDGEKVIRVMPLSINRRIKNGDLLWHFGRTTRWTRGKVLDASNPAGIKVAFKVAGGDSGGPVVFPDGTLAGLILSRSLMPEDIIDRNTSSVGFFVSIDEAIKGLAAAAPFFH